MKERFYTLTIHRFDQTPVVSHHGLSSSASIRQRMTRPAFWIGRRDWAVAELRDPDNKVCGTAKYVVPDQKINYEASYQSIGGHWKWTFYDEPIDDPLSLTIGDLIAQAQEKRSSSVKDDWDIL